MRSYSELILLDSYKERLEYLKLTDNNYNNPSRDITQTLFKSSKWKQVRREVINRDMAFDLGVFGLYIYDKVIVHHINPVTIEDIVNESKSLFDTENLITTSLDTHNRIHYSRKEEPTVERQAGDTILW